MTVSTQANKAQFNGAGTTGPFTFNFRFFNNSEIYAIKTSSTGVDTNLSESTDYTLTGSGSYSGGSLTLTSSLAVGEKLTVYRVLPLTQATDLRNQGAFFAEVHEDAFDKLTMIVQQHGEEISRAVQIPITSDITPTEYITAIEAIKDEAETAQAGAEAAQAGAEAALDEFTDLYLGVKATDPTTDNDGNALQDGALYFNSVSKRMRVYDGALWSEVTVSYSFSVNTFSGTGSQTAFTLSTDPGTKNNTQVVISGVYQQKSTYSVSGTTLTFTTAPPAGTSNIEVVIASVVQLNVPADGSVTMAKLARVGTSGQFLRSNGPGADPSYALIDYATSAGAASSASGPVFFTAESSNSAIGALCTGYPATYIYNNTTGWGLYSSAGDTLCRHDRASGQNQFFGVLYGGLGVSTDLSGLTQFERSLGANGYQKLPGGLIIQWGQSYSASTGYVMISFPIAFPTAILNVQTTYNRSSLTDNYRGFHTPTTTGVYIGVDASTTNWFAIGY